MTTKRQVLECSGKSPASARKTLPVDLLLEIIACSDLTTVVRWAKTCRILRLTILEPAFRRRLALRSAADGGFDPALLLGVSFLWHTNFSLDLALRVIHTPSPTKHRVCLDRAGSLWKQFKPVASRDGLFLLRRKKAVHLPDHEAPNYELRVCNTITGHVTSLPPSTVFDVYPHVFLSAGGGDAAGSCDYELLVMDRDMSFQTFSSKDCQWGDVCEPSLPESPWSLSAASRPAVVIGRTVYWMYTLYFPYDGKFMILALDVDAEEATTMDLPAGCFSTMMGYKKDKHLLLASVHGRLSLLVAETRGISIWTLAPTSSSPESTATWSRELLISREEIEKPAGLVSSHLPFDLKGFGEGSGAVIVRMDRSALLRIDLRTKVVTRLHNPGCASVKCLFLHETNLVSFLEAMKSV